MAQLVIYGAGLLSIDTVAHACSEPLSIHPLQLQQPRRFTTRGAKPMSEMNNNASAVQRPPIPPFTEQSARIKVQAAEDAWNSRDPKRVALAYTVDSRWRNREEHITGRSQIEAFLTRKWQRELDYRLRKELWAYTDNRIAVTFEYEWHDKNGDWFRSYGNELWEFDEDGFMQRRIASINDMAIEEAERKFCD